jgi:cell division protein FtsB
MKTLWVILIFVLLGLQYKLWLGDGNVYALRDVESKNKEQTDRNQKLQQRNQSLVAEIAELKSGQQALEEKARDDLGMIKPGETYYNLVE